MDVFLSIAGTLTALEDETSDEYENILKKQLNLLSKKRSTLPLTLNPQSAANQGIANTLLKVHSAFGSGFFCELNVVWV